MNFLMHTYRFLLVLFVTCHVNQVVGNESTVVKWVSEIYNPEYSYQLEKTVVSKKYVYIVGSYFQANLKRVPSAGYWLAQFDHSGKKLFFKNYPDNLFDAVESLYVKHDEQVVMVYRDKQRKSHISKLGANNEWELAKDLASGFHTSSILEFDNSLLLLIGHKYLDSSITALNNDLTIKWEKTIDLGKDDFFTDAISDGQEIIVVVNSGKMEQFFMGKSILIIGIIKPDGCCFKELFKTSGRGGFIKKSGKGYSIVFDKKSGYKKEIVITRYDKKFLMKTQKTLITQKIGLSPFFAVAVEDYWVVFMEDKLRPHIMKATVDGIVLSDFEDIEQPPGFGVFGNCFVKNCAIGYTVINQDTDRKWSNKIKLKYLSF